MDLPQEEGFNMGDEPGLVMSVGVDSYKAPSYEIKIDISLSNYKNQGPRVLPVVFC